MGELLSFGSDYMEGAHEEILKRLVGTNMEQTRLRSGHVLRGGAGEDTKGMPRTARGDSLPLRRNADKSHRDLISAAPL